MKTLKKHLEKKGIRYTATTYGANYFNDHSLDLHFDGITIGIDCDNYYAGAKLEKDIEKYCSRYGYSIIQRGGFPGHNYMSVMRTDQWQLIKDYTQFSNESLRQCEKHMHFTYEYYGHDHKELNEELNGIMEFYEDEYKAFLREKAA